MCKLSRRGGNDPIFPITLPERESALVREGSREVPRAKSPPGNAFSVVSPPVNIVLIVLFLFFLLRKLF